MELVLRAPDMPSPHYTLDSLKKTLSLFYFATVALDTTSSTKSTVSIEATTNPYIHRQHHCPAAAHPAQKYKTKLFLYTRRINPITGQTNDAPPHYVPLPSFLPSPLRC